MKQLRERFKNAAPTGVDTAVKRLLAWCAEPSVTDAGDRQRCKFFENEYEIIKKQEGCITAAL